MPKEFGPSVSGYNDPTGRAWETVVFEAGKPVLDRELNLSQDVDGGAAQANLKRTAPSGWLSDDFLTTSSPVSAIFSPSAVANEIIVPNGLKAHVNGWIVNVQHSYNTGSNLLDMGASPAGVGVQRTDVVVLEVWRKLLSASPDTDGKSATGRIWQEGNVATDPANDLVLNYADDILDANLGSESTKRVQIQHRLRVIQGIDLATFPYAMDDPTLVARSVPPAAGTPDGNVTVFAYTNQSSNGDPGLWRAGDGNPANTLGTVDGYMYAIPLLAVFRRNTSAFARLDNHNGAVASPGPSDRPDGLFYDLIVEQDLMDLRSGVSMTGWSHEELLEKNMHFLLDNSLRTEFTNTSPSGGGYSGTTVLLADEIGISNANGGDGTTTGDTSAGQLIGEFDAIRRRFSDRAILETVTVVVDAPGGGWVNGSTVQVDPTALAIYPYGPYNWSSYAPADVKFMDVLRAQWVGDISSAELTEDALPYIDTIENLGADPVVSLDITFGNSVPGALNLEPLHVTLVVGYPPGVGLSHTPIEDYGSASFEVNNPGQLPAGAPVNFDAFVAQDFDHPHREVLIEYETVSITYEFRTNTGTPTTEFYLPERAETVTSVQVNAAPVGYTLEASGDLITLGVATGLGDDVEVTYTARRPLPQNDEQLTIYYRTAAPQTAREALLSTSLTVVPKLNGKSMFVLTTGSGSQDEGYPWPTAYVQTGGIFPGNAVFYAGESELSAKADVSVSDFNADTGLLQLPVYVPLASSPESLTFNRDPADADIENRTYFKSVPAGYIPNAYAQDLSNPDRHKDVYPVLAELADDSSLGRKGQLVLVLLVRYAQFDKTNGVFFDADLNNNTTTASIFRIKGNLLGKRVS